MPGHASEHLPQSILCDPKTKSLLQHLGRLFEHDHLETVAHSRDVRCWTCRRKRGFAPDENVERGKIARGINRLSRYTGALEKCTRLSLRVEQRNFCLYRMRLHWL